MTAKDLPQSRADNGVVDDLAYVRSLAEEGAHAPLVGGIYYVIWGGLLAFGLFVIWLDAVVDTIRLGQSQLYLWVAIFAAGWGLSFTVGKYWSKNKPGAHTMGNQTANAVWMAGGVLMSTLWFSLLVIHDNFTHIGVPPYFLFNLMFPISFGVFGVAFFATAVASRVNWLKPFALLSLIFCVTTLMIMGTMTQLLMSGAGVVLCCLLPGILLMRKEPSVVV